MKQPPAVAVNTIVVVPGDTAVTTPVEASIVATPGAVLVQVPTVASLKLIVWPIHIFAGPNIGPGVGFTVTVVVRGQPPCV
jgi:hypothetical protein